MAHEEEKYVADYEKDKDLDAGGRRKNGLKSRKTLPRRKKDDCFFPPLFSQPLSDDLYLMFHNFEQTYLKYLIDQAT